MEVPEFRVSASMLKKYKNCPFSVFCKITNQPSDETAATHWGDAGNVVHHTLEHYYSQLTDLPREFALAELERFFDHEWEIVDTADLAKDTYWLCVVNGVITDQVEKDFTHLEAEYSYEISPGVNYIGYIDVMNTEKHIVGDWKTSTYKSKKVQEYKEQLKMYALAYRKEHGITPETWVYFNKIDRVFHFKFTDEELKAKLLEVRQIIEEIKQSFKIEKFPRNKSQQNCFFCNYKGVCATDLLRPNAKPKIEYTFNLKQDKLIIEGVIPENIHCLMEQHINYKIKNAQFVIQAMAQKGIKYDGIKRLYKRDVNGAKTSIGYMEFCYKTLKDYAHSQDKTVKVTIKDFRDVKSNCAFVAPEQLNIPYELRDYQDESPDILMKYRWGIVEIGTGGGKTAIAAECIRRTALKTLFVIDNKQLLLQTKREYEEMLGVECGIVGMGIREWDKPIVLATIQTLAKHVKEFASELAEFGTVIFDEVHIIAAKSFETLSKYLIGTKYRFGFSATAKRDDGNDNLIFAKCGEIVFSKKARDLIDDDQLIEPDIYFFNYNSPNIAYDDWQNEYINAIAMNEDRNNLIKEIVQKIEKSNRTVMILAKDIKNGHVAWLNENIPGSHVIIGKTKDDIREEILDAFKNKDIKVLIGNIKIFNKGINIPNLDAIVNAAGNAGDVLTVQTIGRPLRKSKGKTKAMYIDFVDNCGKFSKKHTKSRIDALKAEKYNVSFTDITSWDIS